MFESGDEARFVRSDVASVSRRRWDFTLVTKMRGQMRSVLLHKVYRYVKRSSATFHGVDGEHHIDQRAGQTRSSLFFCSKS